MDLPPNFFLLYTYYGNAQLFFFLKVVTSTMRVIILWPNQKKPEQRCSCTTFILVNKMTILLNWINLWSENAFFKWGAYWQSTFSNVTRQTKITKTIYSHQALIWENKADGLLQSDQCFDPLQSTTLSSMWKTLKK